MFSYVLIACDGIWKIWDNGSVVAFIKETKDRLEKSLAGDQVSGKMVGCDADVNCFRRMLQDGIPPKDLHLRLCYILTAEAIKRGVQTTKVADMSRFVPGWHGSFGPAVYGPMHDIFSSIITLQGSECENFELNFHRCMEAYGHFVGLRYCDLEMRDLSECMYHTKAVCIDLFIALFSHIALQYLVPRNSS
ncbi:unnamed protein product [Soboliphyme baturini]|uniref:Uncharacterized protein n=1 Tax=Soboliphyme baturini TaxID=241478 RepID=A0A3P8DAJ6_9BILA|nr:unnamed protein product [Soboliphyme baturini]